MTRVSHVYVLDAGVLFSTWARRIQDGELVTVPNVLEEVKNRPSKERMGIMMLLGRLSDEQPELSSLEAARAAARNTGDDKVLSHTDIELLGLAHSKKVQGLMTTVVSSDLAVLNTARHMGLLTIDPSGKFQHEIIWSLKCPACNHRIKSKAKSLECPICGTQMRRVVSRRKKTS